MNDDHIFYFCFFGSWLLAFVLIFASSSYCLQRSAPHISDKEDKIYDPEKQGNLVVDKDHDAGKQTQRDHNMCRDLSACSFKPFNRKVNKAERYRE